MNKGEKNSPLIVNLCTVSVSVFTVAFPLFSSDERREGEESIDTHVKKFMESSHVLVDKFTTHKEQRIRQEDRRIGTQENEHGYFKKCRRGERERVGVCV